VSQPGDTLEQEADRVAEQVLRMPQPERPDNAEAHKSPGPRLSRFSPGTSAQSSREVPPVVHEVLRSPGEPLDPATRAFMEPRFGVDFGGVRIHADAEADRSAEEIDALAYTTGSHIVFCAGRYDPKSQGGRKLLAHELTHVMQQGSAGTSGGSHHSPPAIQRLGDVASRPADVDSHCPMPPDSPQAVSEFIEFGNGATSLTPRDRGNITDLVRRWHADGGGQTVRVDGFASQRGADELNWRLSCQRAEAVVAELRRPSSDEPGIPDSFIVMHAHGETSEFGSEEHNRRATIALSGGSGPSPAPPSSPCADDPVNTQKDPLPPVPPFNIRFVTPAELLEIVKRMQRPGAPIPDAPLGASQPAFDRSAVQVSTVSVPGKSCVKCTADWSLVPRFTAFAVSGGSVTAEPKRFAAFQTGDVSGCPAPAVKLLDVRTLILPEAVSFIVFGEFEHYLDFVLAFWIAGGRYLSNVRRLTPDRTHLWGRDQAECEAKVANFLSTAIGLPLGHVSLLEALGVQFLDTYEDEFADDFSRLYNLPDRDHKGGPHEAQAFPPKERRPIFPNIDTDINPFGCNAFARRDTARSFPGIPGVGSAQVIVPGALTPMQPWHVV